MPEVSEAGLRAAVLGLPEAAWRKSSLSAANGCLEVALLPDHVALRDSKDRGGPALLFTKAEWKDFIDRIRAGDLGTSVPSSPL
jgi:hypothetical protein